MSVFVLVIILLIVGVILFVAIGSWAGPKEDADQFYQNEKDSEPKDAFKNNGEVIDTFKKDSEPKDAFKTNGEVKKNNEAK